MKNLLILIVTLSLFSGCAMGTTVPEAVKKSFGEKFPAASNEKWGKENGTEYEASFKLNGIEESANFKEDGTWVETEVSISTDQLPQEVKSAVLVAYPTAAIADADRIERADSGTTYEVVIKDKKGKTELIVSPDGTKISKSEEED